MSQVLSQVAAPDAQNSVQNNLQNGVSLQRLAALFPKHQLTLNSIEMLTYEVDAGFDRGRPDAVFFPETAHDVSKLMQWADDANVPLIARGAGTGLSGGAVAEHGGIVLSFARMNQVLDFDKRG